MQCEAIAQFAGVCCLYDRPRHSELIHFCSLIQHAFDRFIEDSSIVAVFEQDVAVDQIVEVLP